MFTSGLGRNKGIKLDNYISKCDMLGCVNAIPDIVHASFERRFREVYYFDNSTRGMEGGMVIQQTLEGEGFYEDECGKIVVGPGKAMLFCHGEASSYGIASASVPYEFLWVSITGSALREIFEQVRRDFGSVLPMNRRGEAGRMMQWLANEFHTGKNRNRLQLAEVAFRLLMAVYREQMAEQSSADPVAAGRNILENQFRSPKNLKEWADEIGVSREHFSREFHARYGIGPAEFVRNLRLEHAQVLLATTSMGIPDIAAASGFSSIQTFHRAFRTKFRCAPGETRAPQAANSRVRKAG
jgi:AraC-like DNA-binding protein